MFQIYGASPPYPSQPPPPRPLSLTPLTPSPRGERERVTFKG